MLLALVICGVASSFSLLAEVDLSFRPLYVTDAQLKADTEAAYATFGEVADGMVGVLVEATDGRPLLSPGRREGLESLTRVVEQTEGFGPPLGPTRLLLPGPAAPGSLALGLRPLVDPEPHEERSPGLPDAEQNSPSAAGVGRQALGTSDIDVADSSARKARRRHPDLAGTVLSDDAKMAVIWAPLDAPMTEPEARARAITSLEARLVAHDARGLTTRLVGYAVVERAYEGIFLVGMLKTVALAGLLVALLLWLLLGRARSVVVVMAGTALSIPATLGVMGMVGAPVTLVSAAMPTLLMVIGVADAVHLHSVFERGRMAARRKAERFDARRAASASVNGLLRPILLTSATTAAGFLSLLPASLPIVRQFGITSALGVALLLVTNLLVVPGLLVLLCAGPAKPRRVAIALPTMVTRFIELPIHRPRTVATVLTLVFGGLCLAAAGLTVSQPFNQDVRPSHPIRAAQTALEENFAGFQGPEVVVRRRDGAALGPDALAAVARLEARMAALTDVSAVVSILDAFAPETPLEDRVVTLGLLRLDERTEGLRKRLLSDDGTAALVLVRTGDIGTERASVLLDELERITKQITTQTTEQSAEGALDVRLVGSWVRAQRGMDRLVEDLLQSVLLASGLVFLALLSLRSLRRRPDRALLALLANVAPIVATLGLMALVGVPLKIGTSVALVVALGIAVDDTLHFCARLPAGRLSRVDVENALRHVRGPVVVTTLALAIGFACLPLVGLSVVAQMGLIGTAALLLALVADLFLLPALLIALSVPAASNPDRTEP